VASELEVIVEIQAGGIEATEVLAVDVAHPWIVRRRVEGVLVRCAATVEVRATLVGDELDRPAEAGLPVAGQLRVVADPLQ
jgi:hypothetical protein